MKGSGVRVALVVATMLLALVSDRPVSGKFNVKSLLDTFIRRHSTSTPTSPTTTPTARTLEFSYQNCGPSQDPFTVHGLSVLPDPIRVSGNISLSGDVLFTSNVTGPLVMQLKIIKVIGPIKFEIPCVNNFGSCTYLDVCGMLPAPGDCPDEFQRLHIPCSCPFAAGHYAASNVLIDLDLPAKVPSGEYIVFANFQNQQGHVGCVEIFLNLA